MSEALDTTVRYTDKYTAVIVVTGDVDLHTAPVLRAEALTAITRGARHLVLDMAEVDFVDSTGLTTLIVLLHATEKAGGSVRVARVPERLERMVTMTGIAELLPMHDTVADALAALGVAGGTDDDAGHEVVDGAAERGGRASADRGAGVSVTASVDRGASVTAVSADQGAGVSALASADRGVDASVKASADRGAGVSAHASADPGVDVSVHASADRGVDASVKASTDRGAGVSAHACADPAVDASAIASVDPGADASVTASVDQGVDDAFGGAGPSR
ncbi:STAS domain-containing protein [Streptomyces griseoincarnatus]|uniref:Anti-sigma factor antagonist n=1 Tax=Streptomyces griseoincarnatus TaxID=29305 RepID=A0ABT0VKB2_STRGI|nr:STAS domain-containing protein [Streptomyces griseoincarnatus]MCM2511807.1 STAS domain-containing protein [Streptomyces griseoincarnatus]